MSASEFVIVGLPGIELERRDAALLAEHRPGGVILFKRNIEEVEQLEELVAAIRRVLPEAIVAIDAEGGRVDRLRDLVGPAPAAGRLARGTPSFAYQTGRWMAMALRLFDVDLDFAPVVDLDRGESDNALDGRYLGRTPAEIVPRAHAFLRGLHAGGVGGCIKHFPGLGGASKDTHFKIATVFLPSVELATDLEPFATLADLAGAVMVSHAIYPAFDAANRPATLSPAVIGGLLRGRLGFSGLSVSDDLEMKALDEWGDLAERTETCFAAGCDLLLVCHTLAALPEIAARLDRPSLESRRAEARARLERYRHRLRTLREAQDHIHLLREAERGVTLDEVRDKLAELGEMAEGGTA